MTTTKQRRTKAEPQTPAMPLDLAGVWRWDAHPSSGEWRLQSADFTTKWYVIPKRAEDEARRWLTSQPQSTDQATQVAAVRDLIADATRMVGIGMQAYVLTQARTAAALITDTKLAARLLAEIASVPTEADQVAATADPDWPVITCPQCGQDYISDGSTPCPRCFAARAWQPGPDDAGVFCRPPGSPERRLVDPRTLVDGRWQPRTSMDPIKLEELAASLAEHGVLEDLIAVVNEQGHLELVTGHRRKAAAIVAHLETVPVKIVETTASQARALAIISNDDRDDLTDIERGQAYEAIIIEEGISEAALARRLSRPRAYIQQRRLLARACGGVQQALTTGEISFTQARSIVLGSADSHGAQRAALKAVQDGLRSGRKVSEAEAQRLAEEAVRKEVKKDLVGLGWAMVEEHIGGKRRAYVWGGSERPTEWSAAELLTAVRELRRPTGAQPEARTIVQIAIVDRSGAVLLNTLVNPQVPIEPGAEAVHGITQAMVADAPTFAEIVPQLQAALFFKRVWIYNARFDIGILENEYTRIGRVEGLSLRRWLNVRKWECVMELYAEWVGEWSHYFQSYRWQRLPGGDHDALGDAQAALGVLQRMAVEEETNVETS